MRQLIKQRIKNEKGLTLIELLAVIVILGIIAAIAVPSIAGIIQNSKEDAVKADAITVLNAAKNYVAANDIPKNGKIDQADLKSYVSGLKTTFGDYVVTSADGINFTLTTTNKVVAGKKFIKFTSASIDDINNDNSDTVIVTDN
ncbi:type II secretion system protein [Bacillus circulans]|jgi:type IV pilus assembly protein PilA|uniref:prepilin-type N-terminal cleavage/methylation domain-containing protein n=1 Tax=Niallia circulans TaxID=1397 RepID=UPI00148F4B42|nr:type II secretion system protein [Niallia circulans]NRG26268.1 type II secretion system protein [Niallia circulans]QJX63291.1 type II secretion system protein [Niallia circulans]UQZ76590.1 prepilin-type cleavage/methylation domain-containing protein [Niallia circulans]